MAEDLYEDGNDLESVEEDETVKELKKKHLLKEIIYDDYIRSFDMDDKIIYLSEEIFGEGEAVDFVKMARAIIRYHKEFHGKEIDSINLVIDSPGGSVHEMLGIIDYMDYLDKKKGIKVNTICRGQAMSAGAMLLACGTGRRFSSPNSSIMMHDLSGFNFGKAKDIKSHARHTEDLQQRTYKILGSKTKKDAKWWEEKMATDFFLTPDQAIEFGIIDEII